MRTKILILILIGVVCYGQLHLNNNTVQISDNGVMTYRYIHAVASADSIVPTYVPAVTRYRYQKIETGALTVKDTVGITVAGDSIFIQSAGDYLGLASITIAGDNNVQWRVKLYANNAPSDASIGRFVMTTSSATRFDTYSYFWYKSNVPAGTWLSLRITNLTNDTDPSITDYKIYIRKEPEL